MVYGKETMGKDVEWKSYFTDNHRYADIINGIGCDGVQLVKDTDLQEVDSGSGKMARDLLRRTAFGANFALIGIENQEGLDYQFPLRNMSYDVFQYQKQLKEIRRGLKEQKEKLKPEEYLYSFKKDSRLHPIITFVLYAGKDPWEGPVCLHDILDFSEIPDKLKNMTPNYPVNIIDIRRLEDTTVFKTDVRQVFDFIRCADDKKKLLELVESDMYYQQMDEEAFDVVTKYTNSKELVQIKEELEEGGKKDVCKAIRDLMDDSREEGREEGIEANKLENARNLLGLLPDEVIAEKIGLPLAVVKEMYNEIVTV